MLLMHPLPCGDTADALCFRVFCHCTVRLPAIICWFTFLFAVIAAAVSFAAFRRARNTPYPAYANNSNSTDHEVSEKDKAQLAQEKA